MPVSRKRRSKGTRRTGGGRDPVVALMREAARYPLRECLINKTWRDQKLASILLTRSRPDGRLAFAAFCVDTGCLGVKSATGNPSISEWDYRQAVNRLSNNLGGLEPCDPALALKVIRGARNYAARLGFKPDPDYSFSVEMFGTIDPESCGEEIEFGRDGKPLYVAGPNDDIKHVVGHLTRSLGPGGFHYIIPMDLDD